MAECCEQRISLGLTYYRQNPEPEPVSDRRLEVLLMKHAQLHWINYFKSSSSYARGSRSIALCILSLSLDGGGW